MSKLNNLSLINSIKTYINNNKIYAKHFDFSYKTQNYSLDEVLPEIIKIIKYANPWRSSYINHSTLYSVYKKMLKMNIIKNTYIELLNLYIKKQPNKKLKYLYTDTTCIKNKYGSELVKYNGHKKMNCTKVSFITDSNGIPINVGIFSGSKHDSQIFIEQLNNKMLIDETLLNKNKKYMLADSGYDTNDIKQILNDLNFTSIIANNKRRKKQRIIFNAKYKRIYSKRIKIEHTNELFKTNRRCNCRYDKNINTFEVSIYLSLVDLILKYM